MLGVERVRADLERLQFVVRLQVGPAPHATVDDVRQPLAMGDLSGADFRETISGWTGRAVFGQSA